MAQSDSAAITAQTVINVLNQLVALDQQRATTLMFNTWAMDSQLKAHANLRPNDKSRVRTLDLVNALFGLRDPEDVEYVQPDFDEQGDLTTFVLSSPGTDSAGITASDAVTILNQLQAIDPARVARLMVGGDRAVPNSLLKDHAGVRNNALGRVRPLDLLNALFGLRPSNGVEYIACTFDAQGILNGFELSDDGL
jgi:hypothetical protein